MNMLGYCTYFGTVLTLAAYFAASALKKRFKSAFLNPILISIIIIISFLMLTDSSYEMYEESAKYISWFLTPATVALAVPLYRKLEILKKNFTAVFCGIISGVIASCIGVFMLAVLFNLSHTEYVTLLPKSVTTAIGMGISQELGGISAISVPVIIITGVFGNMTAELVFKIFKITNPLAKGLAIGTSSHGIGTAKAIELGEVEGAMSGLSIAVSGIITVIAAQLFALIR